MRYETASNMRKQNKKKIRNSFDNSIHQNYARIQVQTTLMIQDGECLPLFNHKGFDGNHLIKLTSLSTN